MRHCTVSTFRGTLETGSCGEPATAVWDWGGDPLYVCEKHDAEIRAKDEGWGRRREYDRPTPARQLDPILGTYNEDD